MQTQIIHYTDTKNTLCRIVETNYTLCRYNASEEVNINPIDYIATF